MKVSPELQTVVIGQQLETNYSAHELSTCDESTNESCSVTLNTALLGCVKMLEAENAKLNYNVKRRNTFE